LENEKKYRYVLLQYYELIDDIIFSLCNKVKENTLKMIVSDHGFGPLYKFININQWLIELKLMNVKNRPLNLFRYFLFKMNFTPNNVYNLLIKLKLYNLRAKLGRSKGQELLSKFFFSFSDIDWNRTAAYSLGSMGQIHLNVKFREPEGTILRDSEYAYYSRYVVEKLKKMKDSDLKNYIIDKVYLKKDLYDGKYYEELPDIIFLPKEGYISFEEFEFASNKIFSNAKGISGTHRLNGIFIMECKKLIKNGVKLKFSPKITDVFPTIMEFLNIPIEAEVDGNSIFKTLRADIYNEK
jgi:predicted AlkP superfamily phosphohydrolase/phosphomutase